MRILVIWWQELRILVSDMDAFVIYGLVPLILIGFSSNAFQAALDFENVHIRQPIAVAQAPAASKLDLRRLLAGYPGPVVASTPLSRDRVRRGELAADVRLIDGRVVIEADPGNPMVAQVVRESLLRGGSRPSVASLPVAIDSPVTGGGLPTPYDFTVPGYAVLFAFFAMGAVAFSFYREQWFQTWKRLMSAPVRRSELVAGKLAAGVTVVVVQFAALLLFGSLVLGVHLGRHPVLLAPVVVSGAVVVSAFGVLLAALTRSSIRVSALTATLTIGLGGAGGAIVPLPLMPSWLAWVAPLTPQYWMLGALQDVMLRGFGLADILPSLAVLWGIAIAAFAVGVWRLRLEKLLPTF